MKTQIELTTQEKRNFDKLRREKQAVKLLKDRIETEVETIKGEFPGETDFLYAGRKVYSIASQPQSKFDKAGFINGLPGTIPAKHVKEVLQLIETFTETKQVSVFRCH